MKIRSLSFLAIILAFLGMVTACDNPTSPVKSGGSAYTVKFEANGGSPAPQDQTINHGGKVTEPASMTKTDYSFGGWYKEENFVNLWNFYGDIVTGNTTLYAKWGSINYTVSFEANGGSPAPQDQTINHGGTITEPASMTKTGYSFGGWYIGENFFRLWDFAVDTVTYHTILHAKWEPLIIVTGENLASKLQWLSSNAESDTVYILEATAATEYLNSQTFSYSGKSNITIQLTSSGSVKNVELYSSGSLFTIGSGVTLILENIILAGSTNNNAALISVNGGNLIMNSGAKITGNTFNSFNDNGGGVYVGNYATFTMNGGEISGNTSSYNGSGGVCLSGGTFTMSGGEISGNTSNSFDGNGGGVHVGNYATFTMSGGEISGNITTSYGGGVYVSSGTFSKTGGVITGYSSDTVNGNVVKVNHFDIDIIQINSGHAVYVANNDERFIRRKETTSASGDNLSYIPNEPAPPTISGSWEE